MSNISVCEFESNSLEVVIVNGEPWFNASQVAIALGYKNPPKAIQDNVSAKYNQTLDLGRPGKKTSFYQRAWVISIDYAVKPSVC